MAYYNGFPATYTPYYTPVAPVQQPAPPVQATVQGGVITGMPSIKVLDYTVRETAKNGANSPVPSSVGKSPEYATKDDLRALSDRIDALKEKVKGMIDNDE